MAAILTNGVLKVRTAPIFQPLLAPARYKGSGSTKAPDVPSPMPRIGPGGRQHRLELTTQRQTAKLTLSQLINRLLPQRTPVRHRPSNRRRLVRPNNQITRALAPPSFPRPPSPPPHDLTPKLRATRPSFVTRYRAGDIAITSTHRCRIKLRNTRELILTDPSTPGHPPSINPTALHPRSESRAPGPTRGSP